jgi:uncharacterized membrane protein
VVGIKASIPENKITFRWTYIVLPLAFLLLSLVLAVVFYQKLPVQLAYHFQGNQPDRWLSRGALLAWMLLPQLCFTLLAFIVVRVVMLSARYWPADILSMARILPVMGNMIALPQIILVFTMLDIFLYNAYEIRLIPVWLFALIIMIAGAAILGYLFMKLVRQARRLRANVRQE